MKRSETINELAVSLVKFNSEVTKIAKDAANPFFKNNYATLDTIIDAIRPILNKNGLSIMQFPTSDGELVYVTTYLLHESGEFMESDPLAMKPVKNDPQAIGSAITYARRYSLQAFLNLNTGEDDDGNIASQKPEQMKETQNKSKDKPKPNNNNSGVKISQKQLKLLNTLISRMEKEKDIERETVIKTLKQKPEIGEFESLTELKVGQASKSIEVLQGALGGE